MSPAAVSPKNILVVDDNSSYRELVRIFLEKNSYRVSDAPDGNEALKMIKKQIPDLILMDLHMPNKNGFETLQDIRASLSTHKIPVILVSASPANLRQVENLYLDVTGLLDKSTTTKELLSAVQKATGTVPSQTAAEQEDSEESLWKTTENQNQEEDISSLELIDNADEKKEEQTVHQLEVLANDSPVIKLANQIFMKAVQMGASDIHIEPQESKVNVRFRLDGVLKTIKTMPIGMHPRLTARIKIISNLIVTERRLPQDGQFQIHIKGQKIEFRVSTLPSLYGEKIVMRLLGQGKVKSQLEGLGFNERDLDVIKRAIRSPHGLVLVTGPTGSGKTTTLYTMISVLNQENVNIMTAEDPVEYQLPGITQVPVRTGIGLTFQSVLRAFLRQDPDVILIGEIRDLETAEIAAKASITGHLVLSTLHTNSAAATVTRMINMGLAPYMVSACLQMVIAQRLIRLLCPRCKVSAELSAEDKRILGADAENMPQIFRGTGCRHCQMLGYSGRKPIFEVMPVSSSKMRQAIIAGKSSDALTELASKEGMTSLRAAALQAVAAGETSLQEAYRILLTE